MAKTMELTAFDPRVAQAQDEVARATAKLAHASREETLQAARKLLEANVRLYGSLLAHPEYPAEGHEDPDSLGAEATRMAVESMAGMLPKGSVERILEELFDVSREQTGHVHCENCGALVEAAEVEQSGQCPYCGGIIRVRTESAWFRQLKGTWEVTRSSTPVEQHAVAALQLLIGSYHTTGQVPSRDDAVAFLEWALPYVPREELAEALQMLSSVYGDSDPNVANLLHAIERRIQAWPCAGETPVALPRPPDHAPAELPAWPPPEEDLMASPGPSPESPGVPRGGDLSEDPWVVQSVAMWKMSAATIRADEREPSLVSFALNPFYLGGSTTVAQALEFFRQAEPGYSRERMKEYVDLLLAAHTTDPPNYFWFLQELRRALDN